MTRRCHCGAEFRVKGTWSRRRWCDECVHKRRVAGGLVGAARSHSHRETPVKQLRICGHCSRKFEPNGRWKFCSQECMHAANEARETKNEYDGKVYLPTEEEIAAHRLAFQATWSDWERARRAGRLREFLSGVETEVVPVRALVGP